MTVAIVPVDTSVWMVFNRMLSFPAAVVIPVIFPALLILLMVLFFVALLGLVMFTFIAVMVPVPVPAVQLLNVFPLRILDALPTPASVFTHPEMVAVPLMLM